MTATPSPRPTPAEPSLKYPLGTAPEPGHAVEVVPGVLWLRMPLPFKLSHINLWALDDGDGWTVVDTGLNAPATISAWERVLAGPLGGRPVKRVICTHMHPDHIGMAGWLTERFGCRLWITRLEYLTCRTLTADTGRTAPEDGIRFYKAAGSSDELLQQYQARFGAFGMGVYRMPDSFRRLSDGEDVTISGRTWRVVVGHGHSPEHACLYCPELDLLISGDQVLPKISSNVSVYPTEPDADPLSDWIDSLAKLRRLIPDSALVLPAHNEPFLGLHARLDRLEQSHHRSLQRLQEALAQPQRAVDVFRVLFGRTLDGEQHFMGAGESLAHLNWLLHRNRATVTTDDAGVNWYRAV